MRQIKDKVGDGVKSVWMPAEGELPTVPSEGHIFLKDAKTGRKMPGLVPASMIQNMERLHHPEIEAHLSLLPALPQPVYVSKLHLRLSGAETYVCMEAFDALRYLMLNFYMCAGSSDIAESEAHRRRYLKEHGELLGKAHELFDAEVTRNEKSLEDGTIPSYETFLRMFHGASRRFLIRYMNTYEMTILKFWMYGFKMVGDVKVVRTFYGIPENRKGDMPTRRRMPKFSHCMPDMIGQIEVQQHAVTEMRRCEFNYEAEARCAELEKRWNALPDDVCNSHFGAKGATWFSLERTHRLYQFSCAGPSVHGAIIRAAKAYSGTMDRADARAKKELERNVRSRESTDRKNPDHREEDSNGDPCASTSEDLAKNAERKRHDRTLRDAAAVASRTAGFVLMDPSRSELEVVASRKVVPLPSRVASEGGVEPTPAPSFRMLINPGERDLESVGWFRLPPPPSTSKT